VPQRLPPIRATCSSPTMPALSAPSSRISSRPVTAGR
jgi:hypothetical protein